MKNLKFFFHLAAACLLAGCVHTWRTETTTGERTTWRLVTNADGTVGSVRAETVTLKDLDRGGAITLLSDPKAAQIAVKHTNQAGLGGNSELYMGSIGWMTSSNAGPVIQSAGGAAGAVIGAAVKAAAE